MRIVSCFYHSDGLEQGGLTILSWCPTRNKSSSFGEVGPMTFELKSVLSTGWMKMAWWLFNTTWLYNPTPETRLTRIFKALQGNLFKVPSSPKIQEYKYPTFMSEIVPPFGGTQRVHVFNVFVRVFSSNFHHFWWGFYNAPRWNWSETCFFLGKEPTLPWPQLKRATGITNTWRMGSQWMVQWWLVTNPHLFQPCFFGHLEGEQHNPILKGDLRSPWLLTTYIYGDDPPSKAA